MVLAFGAWLTAARAKLSPKSRAGEELAYFAHHWEGLQVFLDDGRVEIDTNAVGNRIPLVFTRKNALFAGHDEGAGNWGRIASLIETAKRNGVDPVAYLTVILGAIARSHPKSRLDELLPWAVKPKGTDDPEAAYIGTVWSTHHTCSCRNRRPITSRCAMPRPASPRSGSERGRRRMPCFLRSEGSEAVAQVRHEVVAGIAAELLAELVGCIERESLA
ncbi:transposase domain-containing protein [Benzoatithermus flavus]|uniref:transposase domain-containing protein n=1 Tax=Benzoatithermus flavus TaxID=3108223 RepID=UPI003AAC0A77